MTHFTLTKSKHLLPFAAVLHQHGVHVHRLLKNANLPPTCLDHPEAFIPGVYAGQFRDLAAQKVDDPNISLQAARYVDFGRMGNFGRALGMESTLRGALHKFHQLVATETSNVIIELHSQPNGDLWFNHRILSHAAKGGWHSDLYVITWMLKIVRLVDPVRSPAEISLAVEERRERFEAIEMLGSTARFQKNSTGFLVPASMLALPVTKHPAQGEDIDTDLGSTAPAEICAESIREIVLSYATDGWLSIEQFSEVARTSVRTTQRCLAMEQKTYSDLIQQCRAEMAGGLLENTDVAIAEIANQLGYSSQGNFTRAFYRWAKVSPSAFRKQRSRTR
jgi:AraC-like DNA-binding protein